MRIISSFALVGALISQVITLPSFCADVGLVPGIGAGSRLSTYDDAVPGKGFSATLAGDRRTVKDRIKNAWPSDPEVVSKIDRLTASFGLGISPALAVAVGLRQIKEEIEIPALYDKEGKLISPARKVEGPGRVNALYSLSLRLLHRRGFGLAMTAFGSAYYKQNPKAPAGLNEGDIYQPSYSLPLKPNFGAALHGVARLGRQVSLYLTGGDRYHNGELIGEHSLGHELFAKSQVAWHPIRYLRLKAGYDFRRLQLVSQQVRGGDGKSRWREHGALNYGVAAMFQGFWLEAFARNEVTGDKNWAATADAMGLAIGYRFGQKRTVRRTAKRYRAPRALPAYNGRAMPKAGSKTRAKTRAPFYTGRQRVRPPARKYGGKPRTWKPPQHRPAVVVPKRASPPKPRPLSDIREAERIAAQARLKEQNRAAAAEAAERQEREAQQQARWQQIQNSQQQEFPEIDNLPDVTDQEYFWNGLED